MTASREPRDEAAQGTLVRLHADGADPGRHRVPAAGRGADDQRPLRPAHAGAGGGGHHAGLPDGVHADGHGHHLRVLRLPLGRADGGRRPAPDARPDGAARVLGDEQRRAHLDPAVRLHGLPGRARQPDREAVQEPPPVAVARAGFAGGGHAVHLRHLRHRHRHRRRGGHADGAAGVSADAARGLRRAGLGRRHHGRGLPGHPDPAVGHVDRLWRHGRRLGGAALRRRLLPGADAGRAVRDLRGDGGQAQAGADAAAVGCRARGAAARAAGHSGRNSVQPRAAGHAAGPEGAAQCQRAHRLHPAPAGRGLAAGAAVRAGQRGQLAPEHRTGRGRRGGGGAHAAGPGRWLRACR